MSTGGEGHNIWGPPAAPPPTMIIPTSTSQQSSPGTSMTSAPPGVPVFVSPQQQSHHHQHHHQQQAVSPTTSPSNGQPLQGSPNQHHHHQQQHFQQFYATTNPNTHLLPQHHHHHHQQQLPQGTPTLSGATSSPQQQQHLAHHQMAQQQQQLRVVMVMGANGQQQMCAVDPSTGNLIPLQQVAAPPPPQQMIMLPNGQIVPAAQQQQQQLHPGQFGGGGGGGGLVSLLDPSLSPGAPAAPLSFPSPAFLSGSSTTSPGNRGSPSGSSTTTGLNTSTRAPCDVARWGYAIVDPYHTSLQRVPIPPHVVNQHTKGVANYNNDVQNSSTKPCTSNICVKHVSQFGCTLGEECPNFHIKPEYVEKARKVVEPICCGLHNDYFTQEMLRVTTLSNLINSRFVVVLEDRSEVDILPAQLAFTSGLDSLGVRSNTRVINLKKHVCRLHLEGRCKWTKDCGHVHLCKEFISFLSQFHYPSLLFLLQTETDEAKIVAKLQEAPYARFLHSRSIIPLIVQMMNSDNKVAVLALIKAGANVTELVANRIKERYPEVGTIDGASITDPIDCPF